MVDETVETREQQTVAQTVTLLVEMKEAWWVAHSVHLKEMKMVDS